VLGKPFEETHWWAHSPAAQHQLRETIVRGAQGDASRYDVRTQGIDNEVIDIDFSLQPLRDETGEVVFLIPSAIVVTERKRAEDAYRQSRELLGVASRVGRMGAWSVDLPDLAVNWSDELRAILDLPPGHVPASKRGSGSTRPSTATASGTCSRPASGTARRSTRKCRPTPPGATACGCGSSARPCGTRAGRSSASRARTRTSRTAGGSRRRCGASQARLNSALAAGAIGTWTWDIVKDCLTADEFTARLFSIAPDAAANGLPAEAYLRAVLEEDQPDVADGLARAIASCGYYDIEYRVRQRGGELRWLQAKGRVEGDAAGNALTFHGAVMDITERKRTEGRFPAARRIQRPGRDLLERPG